MADENKRYYWLQLKEDFFRRKEIKLLRRIAGGDTYTIIYLKMMLMSLKDGGKIYFEGVAEDLAEEIALEIDEEVENVQITINYLVQKGLLVSSPGNEAFMSDVPNMIGSESDSARRVRKHRQIQGLNQKTLQCNTAVTIGNTDIDIEIDTELNKNIYTPEEAPGEPKEPKEPTALPVVKEIVDYLNLKAGTKYKTNSDKTRKLIEARIKEGNTIDDFKTVINKKTKEWLKTDMSKFLRPETLFGSKFESYLNQLEAQQAASKNKFINFEQRTYDYDDLERKLLKNQGGRINGNE